MAARRISAFWILGFLVCAAVARAGETCTQDSADCVPVGQWTLSAALGAGVRTNPLHHGSDIPLVVIPQFSYYGKRFFIDNLDPGLTLYDGESNTFNLIATPGYDRVFFYRSDLQNFFIGRFYAATHTSNGELLEGVSAQLVAARHPAITYLAGPEWTFKYGAVSGQLDVLREITGHDHGEEIRAAVGIPLGQLFGTWKLNAGLTWKSAGIVNYYYGYPGLYEAGSALNPFAKIGFSRPLNRRWQFDAFVHCERLSNAIVNSPIIGQRYVTTAFVGATYVIHR